MQLKPLSPELLPNFYIGCHQPVRIAMSQNTAATPRVAKCELIREHFETGLHQDSSVLLLYCC